MFNYFFFFLISQNIPAQLSTYVKNHQHKSYVIFNYTNFLT
jgi:hypothetical protein